MHLSEYDEGKITIETGVLLKVSAAKKTGFSPLLVPSRGL